MPTQVIRNGLLAIAGLNQLKSELMHLPAGDVEEYITEQICPAKIQVRAGPLIELLSQPCNLSGQSESTSHSPFSEFPPLPPATVGQKRNAKPGFNH